MKPPPVNLEARKGSQPFVQSNVLVVDDTPANLRLLLNMLLEAGYDVRPITGGSQALVAAQTQPPDIILLDINMPEMNGYDVAKRLKENPDTAEIPIIFISAYDDVSAKVKAFEAGGVDYIVKPFQEAVVLARVQTHLNLIHLQREIVTKSLEAERSRLLATFIDKASHEFRTPLTAILSAADLIERTADRPEYHPKYTAQIRQGGKQIETLVANMLLIMQLNTSIPFEKRPINLETLLKALMEAVTDERIRLNIATKNLTVIANQEMLFRALQELLQNAQNHTPRTGWILIEVQSQQNDVIISIEDSGVGISDEHFAYVFELFYRADKAHSTRGLGLGLPIAKRIIEQHDGLLRLATASDRGIKAVIKLPISAESDA